MQTIKVHRNASTNTSCTYSVLPKVDKGGNRSSKLRKMTFHFFISLQGSNKTANTLHLYSPQYDVNVLLAIPMYTNPFSSVNTFILKE